MLASTVLVALLACQVCAVDGYKLANTRMQIKMASSNPLNSFLGGLNKPSPSSGGNRRFCHIVHLLHYPFWGVPNETYHLKEWIELAKLTWTNPFISCHISRLYLFCVLWDIATNTLLETEHTRLSNSLDYAWCSIEDLRLWLTPFHFSGAGKTVLITGATGLIGTELTKSLRSKRITVRRLTTGTKKDGNDFSWDPSSNSIGKN